MRGAAAGKSGVGPPCTAPQSPRPEARCSAGAARGAAAGAPPVATPAKGPVKTPALGDALPESPIPPAGGGCVRKPQRCSSPTFRETPPPPPPEPNRAERQPRPRGVQTPQPSRARRQLCGADRGFRRREQREGRGRGLRCPRLPCGIGAQF